MPSNALTIPARLRRLIDDPSAVCRAVGVFMAAESRRAWKEKKFGGVKWARQYPNIADPFLHLAGALQDLKEGPRIRQTRFKRKGPLVDKGILRRSIGYRCVKPNVVEVGVTKNVLQYARKHARRGGMTTIVITKAMRKNLRAFYRTTTKAKKKVISAQFGWAFNAKKFTQRIKWRPFIGVTTRARRAVPLIVQAVYENRPVDELGSV